MHTRDRRPMWTVRIHAALVAVLLAAFCALRIAGAGPDANIGAGLVGLPLIGLGLPWSWAHLASPELYDRLPALLWWPAAFGPAVLNVGLHALAVRLRRRSRHPA
ncbi:hypothetical protein GCM10009613_29730 [Pseudonocardia kongjuensis]|uniref:Uncharacterized protein n=1 Tax=Pseudonocardia kongjuensis TaxID=102227 RepID=A0ABN1XTN0_9PSEU